MESKKAAPDGESIRHGNEKWTIQIITQNGGKSMPIGILALVIGAIFLLISYIGIRDEEPPVREEKTVRYPYPREI